MKAAVLTQLHAFPVVQAWPDPVPAESEVVVRLSHAALNRRDYWITRGLYPGIRLPVVLGSDGVGVVEKTGSAVADPWHNGRVLINPGLFWGDDPRVQSRRFEVLGLPRDGTFAERVVAPAENIYPAPAHLSDEEAAALPLAGVTAYRALFTRGELQPHDRVLITGIGGGVATMVLQLALPSGAEIWVTSSSEEKIARAVEMGARGGFLYTEKGWYKQALKHTGGFSLIIDSGGGRSLADAVEAADFAGRIVIFGGTQGPVEGLLPARIFWKQLDLRGSTMGSPADFEAMLAWVTQHRIRPVVDSVFSLDEVEKAFDRIAGKAHMGKIVLSIS